MTSESTVVEVLDDSATVVEVLEGSSIVVEVLVPGVRGATGTIIEVGTVPPTDTTHLWLDTN